MNDYDARQVYNGMRLIQKACQSAVEYDGCNYCCPMFDYCRTQTLPDEWILPEWEEEQQ